MGEFAAPSVALIQCKTSSRIYSFSNQMYIYTFRTYPVIVIFIVPFFFNLYIKSPDSHLGIIIMIVGMCLLCHTVFIQLCNVHIYIVICPTVVHGIIISRFAISFRLLLPCGCLHVHICYQGFLGMKLKV